MATKLKLTGLKTFIASFTAGILISKNDVILVSDEIADKLIQGEKSPKDAEDQPVPYWTEPEAGDKVTYDFTNTEPGSAPKVQGAAPRRTAAAPAPAAAPVRKTAARQRK